MRAPLKDRHRPMESFFTAETLKYLYLLFGDGSQYPLDEYVLNTEGAWYTTPTLTLHPHPSPSPFTLTPTLTPTLTLYPHPIPSPSSSHSPQYSGGSLCMGMGMDASAMLRPAPCVLCSSYRGSPLAHLTLPHLTLPYLNSRLLTPPYLSVPLFSVTYLTVPQLPYLNCVTLLCPGSPPAAHTARVRVG